MEIILYSNKQILGGFVLVILIGLLFASNIMLTNLEGGINMSYFISPIIFTICIISILYIGSLRKSINQTYDKYVLPDNFSIYNCPDGYRKEIEGENVKCQPINGIEQEPTPEEPVQDNSGSNGSGDVIESFNQLNPNSCVNVSYMDNGEIFTAQQMCKKLGRSVKLDNTCINEENQYGDARYSELCAQGFNQYCFNTNICENINACCEEVINSNNDCNNFKSICGNDKNLSYDNKVADNECKTLEKLPKGLTTQYGYKYGWDSETGEYEDLVENNNEEDPFEYK